MVELEETYHKAKNVSDIFLDKDVYALGVMSILLRLIFLFFCLVLLPVLILLNHIEFTEEPFDWIMKILLLIIISFVLMGFFILLIKIQAYFYKKSNSNNIGKFCQLHLTPHNSFFSFQYSLLFDFATRKAVLVNHYKKSYLIRNFSDITKWRMQHKNNATFQRLSLFGDNSSAFYFQFKDTQKTYLFTFRTSKKQAQKWVELLGENISFS